MHKQSLEHACGFASERAPWKPHESHSNLSTPLNVAPRPPRLPVWGLFRHRLGLIVGRSGNGPGNVSVPLPTSTGTCPTLTFLSRQPENPPSAPILVLPLTNHLLGLLTGDHRFRCHQVLSDLVGWEGVT